MAPGAAGGTPVATAEEEKKELSRGFPWDMSGIRERRDDRGASAILSS